MLPLTVSATTAPVTPVTVTLQAKPSTSTRLPCGTRTSRCDSTPCGMPSISTSTCVRPRDPDSSTPSAPAPSWPVTATSAFAQPTTRTEPAQFSMATTPSGEALRRASTFCWARAAAGQAAKTRKPTTAVRDMTLLTIG